MFSPYCSGQTSHKEYLKHCLQCYHKGCDLNNFMINKTLVLSRKYRVWRKFPILYKLNAEIKQKFTHNIINPPKSIFTPLIFDLSAFFFNYVLESSPGTLHCGLKSLSRNFGPFSFKRFLQCFSIGVCCHACLFF